MKFDPEMYSLPERRLRPMSEAPRDGTIVEILTGYGAYRGYHRFSWRCLDRPELEGHRYFDTLDGTEVSIDTLNPKCWVSERDPRVSVEPAATHGWRSTLQRDKAKKGQAE